MNSKKSILVLGPTPPAIGGISTYVSDLLNSPLNKRFNFVPFPKNHPVFCSDNSRFNHSLCTFFYFFRLSFSFIFYIDKFIFALSKCKIDVVHIHTSSYLGFLENSLYVLISKIFRKKIILHIHGGSFDIFFLNSSYIKKIYIRYILSLSDKIICLSSYWRDFFVNEIGLNKCLISAVPNGYNSSLFYPMNMKKCRISLNLPLDKKILLTVGNLVDVKGHSDLIKAMEYITLHRKDVVCLIIGEGPLKNKLVQQINNLKLSDYIQLVGNKPHSQISIWMNACDLFILPSIIESFGLVQVEAMACGKPVISTYNGGSEEIIISKEIGTLCQHSNPTQLADAILLALNTNYSIQKITTNCLKYRWVNISKHISNIYELL